MRERPILFSGPLVLALLEGRKTQTRRLVTSPLAKCQVGDRLWVRETWAEVGGCDPGDLIYRATYDDDCRRHGFDRANLPPVDKAPWRPSIHMPRRASRLTLEVEAVRRQRLQELDENDAVAEGIRLFSGHFYIAPENDAGKIAVGDNAWRMFGRLWDSLHAQPGTTWDDNPEVVAITFRRVP